MERSQDDAFGDLEALSEAFFPILPNPLFPFRAVTNLRTKTSLSHWAWISLEALLWGRKSVRRLFYCTEQNSVR